MERNMSREREINISTLVGQMNTYLAAYSRYQQAVEDGYTGAALNYMWDDLQKAHTQLLQDGHAQLTEDNVMVVMLPARGRVGKLIDIPRYRRFIGYQHKDPLKVYKFSGMQGNRELWDELEQEAIPLFRHEVPLNEAGEGYCLLYEDVLISYM
jgi:hypothetical protein